MTPGESVNAPEHPPIERAAIDGAQYLPLNLCKAASLNPRKRFNQAALNELADSIEKFGVMQPVLARPIVGAKRGAPQYEIVAGERRYRGCMIVAKRRKESDIALIPAIVRELSDFEALELATTENLHREDMHPLEEAEGYEGLLLHPVAGGEFQPPRTHGYTVDELAVRLGKSRGYVFGRLKLLALIPEARTAYYDDKISTSVALLLARMPASVQKDATKDVVKGWGGEPLSFRGAREMLERDYMLKLSTAPFKITDESLVPGAGNCKECPKRTGANPDLFNDVKSADVCTDPKCFATKKDAHQARLIATAKDEGREVIIGAAAKKVKPHQHGSDLNGYMVLDKVEYSLPGNKTLAQHLGKDAPAIALLEDPHTHELVKVVRKDDAMQVLRDKGVLKSGKLGGRSDSERKAEAKAKAETLWRITLAERAVAAVVNHEFDDLDVHAWLLPEVALAMWNRMDFETTKRARKLLGWAEGSSDVTEKHIRGLTSAQLDQALVAMSVAGQLHVGQYSGDSKPTRLLQIAGRLGIDGAAVRAELDVATKAKVKKLPAKPVVKYRYAPTGETWSGRGLQPKWLKAALARGKMLADFAVDSAPAKSAASPAPVGGEGSKTKKVATKKKAAPKVAAQAAVGEGSAAAEAAEKRASSPQEPPAKGKTPAAQISAVAAWPFPQEPAAGYVAPAAGVQL